MSDTLDTGNTELRLRRFENAWLQRSPEQPIPDWRHHLPADHEPCRPEWIADLLRRDIEHRIDAGLSALLSERYFEHPRLQRSDACLDSEQQIELIRWEYQQRWRKGERARRGEYQSAYPQFSVDLSHLKPSCNCPRCQRTIALDETAHTLHCPDCDTDSPLPSVSPLLVAALVLPEGDSPGFDPRDYELIEPLGKGGMGEVYRAGDPALGRDLAIKVMKEQYRDAPQAESRFLREARITGSLQHPGIVPIYNLGRLADGRLHYTMRLVRGRTFADILKDEAGKPERWPELLSIFLKICQAVAYAHSKRVIHRDLKPHNVMVGKFGEVQVMDWGLAKRLSAGEQDCVEKGQKGPQGQQMRPGERGCVSAPSMPLEVLTQPRSPQDASPELTRMGAGIGTPAYMPPEQALGEWGRVDERADVFALGAILCEILTGAPPYSGRDVILRAKRGEVAEALERLERCGAEAALTTLCRECLSPQRDDRPRHAGATAQRVADYQAEVQARLRQAELERTRALVKAEEERKRRRLALALMLLLLAAAIVGGWQALRATHAAQAETEQRQRAEENARRAEQSKEDADAVLGFFQDKVLSAGRPQGQEGGQGADVKLRAAVDKAEPEIADAFQDRPVVEASIRNTLGITYGYLGLPSLAIPQHERALTLRQTALGDDHPDTLTSMNNLAVVYKDAGRFEKAVRLFEQVLAKRKDLLGPDHRETLASMNNLLSGYRAAGQWDKALPLGEQTLAKMKAVHGADHPDTLTCMNNLAGVYQDAGQISQALPLFEQALAKRKARFGPDHPVTLNSMNNLAVVYKLAGRLKQALPLFEATVAKSEATLGADHPQTLTNRNNLAMAYQAAGQLDKALPLLEQTLAQAKAKLGPDHPDTLRSMRSLALAYQAARQWDKALPLFEQTLAKKKIQLGENHPLTLASMSDLADAYRGAGQLTKALSLFEQTLAKRKAKLGADHADTLLSMNNLATAYWFARKLDRSVPLFEEVLKLRTAKYGADHRDTLLTMANLAVNYRDAGRLADAIPLFESVLQRGRQLSGDLPASLAWVRSELIRTYERAGQLAKAEPFYRELLTQARQQFGSDDPRTAAAMAQLGAHLLQQKKKYAEAEALLRQCLEIRDKKQPDAWNTFNTRSALGEALIGQKKYADAEPLLVQGYQGMKKRQDTIPPAYRPLRLAEALQRLVQLYDAWGKKDEADKWRKTLADAKRSALSEPKAKK